MDIRIINPFLEATLEVTQTMASLESAIGKPALKEGTKASGEVTGLIALKSDDHNGSLAITFEEKAILAMYEQMLGEISEKIDDAVLDLAGEFTNMVCGGAKQRLASTGYNFDITQPEIFSGSPHEVVHLQKGPVITLPVTMEAGKLFIEVNLTP